MKELGPLLGELKEGDAVRVTGYRNSEGSVKNITVRKMGPEGYRNMQEQSLRILQGLGDVVLAGFSAEISKKAVDAVKASLEKSLGGGSSGMSKSMFGPAQLMPNPTEAYYTKPGEPSFYLMNLDATDVVEVAGPPQPKKQQELTKAKDALSLTYNLPTRRYVHSLKFEEGKFSKVERVS